MESRHAMPTTGEVISQVVSQITRLRLQKTVRRHQRVPRSWRPLENRATMLVQFSALLFAIKM
jgi:hypothetical protein